MRAIRAVERKKTLRFVALWLAICYYAQCWNAMATCFPPDFTCL